jgi:hypothetical protein
VATDFFLRQQRARSQAFWLRVVFAIALCFAAFVDAVGIVLFANIATLGAAYADDGHGAIPGAFFHSMEGWTITLVVLLIMGAVSAATAWQHRGGGGALARAMRGTAVSASPTPSMRMRTIPGSIFSRRAAPRMRTRSCGRSSPRPAASGC